MITEQEFHGNGLNLSRTEIHEATGGEIDTLLPGNGATDYRVEVILCRDIAGTVSFREMMVLDSSGGPLIVVDDTGRPLDPSAVEVIAWQMIEDDSELCDGYTQGRSPIMCESPSF